MRTKPVSQLIALEPFTACLRLIDTNTETALDDRFWGTKHSSDLLTLKTQGGKSRNFPLILRESVLEYT